MQYATNGFISQHKLHVSVTEGYLSSCHTTRHREEVNGFIYLFFVSCSIDLILATVYIRNM